MSRIWCYVHGFESLVNTEGFQTYIAGVRRKNQFESLVNTEGFQTHVRRYPSCGSLRVLLIQKDFKPHP